MTTYTIYFDTTKYEVAGTDYAATAWNHFKALAEMLCLHAALVDNVTGEILEEVED